MVKRIRIKTPEYVAAQKIRDRARYLKSRTSAIEKAKEVRRIGSLTPDYRIQRMISSARVRARNRGIDFAIDVNFLEGLWEFQEGRCAISGRLFDLNPSADRVHKNSPSLDRIDSKKGYIKSNVRLVTWQVNCAISEYGLDAFLEMCQDVLTTNKG